MIMTKIQKFSYFEFIKNQFINKYHKSLHFNKINLVFLK
jgi:hypothetical protein